MNERPIRRLNTKRLSRVEILENQLRKAESVLRMASQGHCSPESMAFAANQIERVLSNGSTED